MPVTHQPSMHCLTCDYDLCGLDKNRCPECGRDFDPGNPSTFKSSLGPAYRPVGFAVGHVWFVAIVIIAGYVFLVERSRYTRPWSFDPWSLILWVFCAGLLSSLLGARPKDLLISVIVLTAVLLGALAPSGGPEAWFTALVVATIQAVLLFGGFLAGRLVRKVAHPD